MSSIQKVAVLGASGNLGQIIVPALLKAGFDVTVISRPGGRGYTQANNDSTDAKAIKVGEAAYDDLQSLTTALRQHDALIEVFNPAATTNDHIIMRAALAAGVKQLITNEFGFDTFHPNAGGLPISASKIEAQRALEEELLKAAADGKPAPLAWTAIITNTWYDFAIRAGFFWLNPTERTITRFGSGNQRVSISRAALSGEAVVAVLHQPERFRNRPVYVASYSVTTNELIALAKEISGESDRLWKVTDVPDLVNFKEQGLALWNEDSKGRKSGVDWRHSQAFMMLSTLQLFDEDNQFGADFSDKLEPGWGESREEFKAHLQQLIEAVGK
ncbi:NAD(P)-binding protein [Mollisia scopiformis]|uniref:NAD(P)-binding protein n=1 Tax=Mollisia scopiformis TaxID=149040 RepID=A0A194XNG4_MOLSC|nr:NAD(P)-binding protein [Mollisia scopiformis]KUJ21698.1 NAD(P)-binding protein [Mollisia scopiformis]